MKVALACPSIGQTRRGYERFVTELFESLQGRVNVTLFKGAGEPARNERVVGHLRRSGLLERLTRGHLRYARYHLEFGTFALSLMPRLLRGRFDLVHCIDPLLAPWLDLLRRITRADFRLLYTNAGPVSYRPARWADHIHCLTPAALREALDAGIPPERLTMIPVGLDVDAWSSARERHHLREQAEIPADCFVILSVTSLNRHHKRVDTLIDEVSGLKGNVLLWLDGSAWPDGDASLLDLARTRLGSRFRHTHVPSNQVGDLYALADVVVSSSLHESFGMAIVEAAASGAPVVTHDSPHFRWLLGSCGHRTDLSVPGNLQALLQSLREDPALLASGCDPAGIASRFGWPALANRYLDLYHSLARDAARVSPSTPENPTAGDDHPG